MGRYIFLDSIDSTNTYAKSLGEYPNDEWTIIRAGRQTGGRGRNGKPFFTDHTGGLWVSVIIPISDISTHFEYNRTISLAILATLKRCAHECNNTRISIKWPNDIYWNDRKIAGILLENVPNSPNTLIIGFGLNVNINPDDFPEELRGRATSVLAETGRETCLDSLLGKILDECMRHLNDDREAVHKLYSDNLYRRGSKAAIDQYTGKFVTVNIDGRLHLETSHGDMFFHSGTLNFLTDGGDDE